MKLSSGEVVEVPNLIRSLAPSSLITQYTQYCEAEDIKPLGSSTLYKILNDCSASVRKCIEGLDYYVAEGGRSFLDLENIIEKLEITDERKKEMISCLLSGKSYLKSDFKVESAVDSITDWKAHLMRSRNQEDARLDLVRDLKNGQVLVTCDWAMKMLPRKYREGQTDWFAKRGMNWHIAVSVLKNRDASKTSHMCIYFQLRYDSIFLLAKKPFNSLTKF